MGFGKWIRDRYEDWQQDREWKRVFDKADRMGISPTELSRLAAGPPPPQIAADESVSMQALGELVRKKDVAGLSSIFNRAADWDTRETVMVGFQSMFREHSGDPQVPAQLEEELPRLLELCRAESSGGSYWQNCIDAAETLLARLPG